MDLGSLHPLPYESIHPTNKQEVARRVALGMQHGMYGDSRAVYMGPAPDKATYKAPDSTTSATAPSAPPDATSAAASAAASDAAFDAASDAAPAGSTVVVHFKTQVGSGGLALNESAACPAVVLNVYCR
jgi:hypothetical protein